MPTIRTTMLALRLLSTMTSSEKVETCSLKHPRQWKALQISIMFLTATIFLWIICVNMFSNSKLLISFGTKQRDSVEYESEEQLEPSGGNSFHGLAHGDVYHSEQTGNSYQPASPQKFVLILDFWERMVNVQTSLKRVVQIGVDANFVVVEPFVYESRVSLEFSFPQHFTSLGLTPQPVSAYFNTDELSATNAFVSYDSFVDAIGGADGNYVFLDAVVIFDWNNSTENAQPYWCHERLSDFKIPRISTTTPTWQVLENVQTGGALCVPPNVTMDPGRINAAFFDDIFFQVLQQTKKRAPPGALSKCETCVSIALLNYRKHAFSGYTSVTGLRPYKIRSPPMRVGLPAMRIASQMHKKYFGGKPFVALQMRTGKAWVLSERNADVFLPWLSGCVQKALIAVRVAKKSCKLLNGGREPELYIASDMYNSGWKGGETCSPDVCDAIEAVKRHIQMVANPSHFVPAAFNITQDVMGMSSAVDAAMSVLASRFVYTSPSNLGVWVHGQRAAYYHLGTTTVNCNIF